MSADGDIRLKTLIIAVVTHGYLFLHYALSARALAAPDVWVGQFPFFLGALTIVSVLLAVLRDPRVVVSFLIAKLGLLGISSYTHVYSLSIDLAILGVIILESVTLVDPKLNYPTAGILAVTFLLHRFFLGSFYRGDQSQWIRDLVTSVMTVGIFAFVSGYLKRVSAFIHTQTDEVERLDEAVSRLTVANIGFQQYARDVEAESVDEERKRITREIHDTTGYAFVNINMLIEGALSMNGENDEEMRLLLTRAQEQAQRGLSETRIALRNLRKIDSSILKGPAAIYRLVKAFREATGVEVFLEYGNVTGMWEPRYNDTIYSFIQEGITNSFRHGKANTIKILFWSTERELIVKIRDDGIGSPVIEEGIGLSGMKERAGRFGGSVRAANVYDGFEVSITIPHSPERTERRDTAV